MSQLLIDWLNNDVKLSHQITSFDSDFKTGYLFGELLYKYNHQNDFGYFTNSDTSNSKINNFVRLQRTISKLGVEFSSRTAADIINGNAAVVKKLLYQLKASFDKIVTKPAVSFHPPTGVIPACNMPEKVGKHTSDDSNSRYFEKSIRMQVKSQNKINMEKLLERFTNEALRQQEEASLAVQIDRNNAENASEDSRKARTYQAEREKEFLKDWQHTGIDNWRKNQAIRKARELHNKKMKDRNKQLRENNALGQKVQAELTLTKDITGFENILISKSNEKQTRILNKFGVTTESILETLPQKIDPENNQNTSPQTLSPSPSSPQLPGVNGAAVEESSSLFFTRLETTVGHHSSLFAEAENTLRRISEKKEKRNKLSENHIKRRNDFINKEQKEILKQASSISLNIIKDSISKLCQTETEVKDNFAKLQEFEKVAKENREHRQTKYEERRSVDISEELIRNELLFKTILSSHEENVIVSKSRSTEMNDTFVSTMHSHAIIVCQEITDKIIETTIAVADYQVVRKGSAPVFVLDDNYSLFKSDFTMDEAPSQELEEFLNSSSAASCLENKSMWNKDFISNTTKMYKEVKAEAVIILGDCGPLEASLEGENESFLAIPPPPTILCEVIQTIRDQVFPLPEKPMAPNVPRYPLTIAIFGKPYSGNTTYAKKLSDNFGLTILNVETLLKEVIGLTSTTGNNKRRRSSIGVALSKTNMNGSTLNLSENESLTFRSSYHTRRYRPQHNMLALGKEAAATLKEGRILNDDFYVRLIIAAICALPPHKGDGSLNDVNGWILDGFPMTLSQAATLEIALSGRVHSSVELDLPEGRACSDLYKYPITRRQIDSMTPSAFDVIIHVNADDDVVLRRALGKKINIETKTEYHLDHNPPHNEELVSHNLISPEELSSFNSLFGDILVSSNAKINDLIQWLDEFGTLVTINNNNKQEELEGYAVLSDKIDGIVQIFDSKARTRKGIAFSHVSTLTNGISETIIENERLKYEKRKAELKANEELLLAQKLAEEQAASKGGKGKKEEPKKKEEEKAKEVDKNIGGKQGGAPVVVATTTTVAVKTLPSTLLPLIDEQLKCFENQYYNGLMQTLHTMRNQHHESIFHFDGIEKTYDTFLDRPDLKQNVLEAFQFKFNQVPLDIRVHNSTKGELALRTKELSNTLWEMCEKRREEGIVEITSIRNDKWIETYVDKLAMSFIVLLQHEVDRFHGLSISLRDYAVSNNQNVFKYNEDIYTAAANVNSLISGKSIYDQLEVASSEDTKGKKAPPPAKGKASANTAEVEVIQKDGIKILIETGKKAKDLTSTTLTLVENIKSSVKEGIDSNFLYEALDEEQKRTRNRLDMIMRVGVCRLQYLKAQSLQSYTRMRKYLNNRFSKEVTAVEEMSNHILECIQKETPIKNLLRLQGITFIIDQTVLLVPEVPDITIYEFDNPPNKHILSSSQLKDLASDLSSEAKGSYLIRRETVSGIFKKRAEFKDLPSVWNNFSESDLYNHVFSVYDANKEGFISWRHLLLSLLAFCLGGLFPTNKELLEMKNSFCNLGDNHGNVNEENFKGIRLWFEKSLSSIPVVENYKKVLWDIFSARNSFNYWSFLMALCASESVAEGLNKASILLSVNDAHLIGDDEIQMIFSSQNCGGDESFLLIAFEAFLKEKSSNVKKHNAHPNLVHCSSLIEHAPNLNHINTYKLFNFKNLLLSVDK